MMKSLVLSVFMLLMGRKLASGYDYCSMNCGNGNVHTMCQYQEGPSYRCGITYGGLLIKEEKDALLTLLNEYRRKFANGEGHNLTTASNMMELIWDDELETIAQRWVDQCWPLYIYDECRATEKFPKVNQNTARSSPHVNISRLISIWYNEIGTFENRTVENYTFNPNNGHFTQMIWAITTHVGCARVKWNDQQEFRCNFGPAGNVLSESVYVPGPPCSNCPAWSWCSSKYKGLCSSVFY